MGSIWKRWQGHPLQQIGKPRIRSKRIKSWIDREHRKSIGVLFVTFLQPVKSVILVMRKWGESERHAARRDIMMARDPLQMPDDSERLRRPAHQTVGPGDFGDRPWITVQQSQCSFEFSDGFLIDPLTRIRQTFTVNRFLVSA